MEDLWPGRRETALPRGHEGEFHRRDRRVVVLRGTELDVRERLALPDQTGFSLDKEGSNVNLRGLAWTSNTTGKVSFRHRRPC